MYKTIDWDSVRRTVVKDGGFVIPDFLRPETLGSIEAELAPWRSQINFNEVYGSSILGENRWIFHVGIASATALKLALDPAILDFMEAIFGEPAILAEFSFQEKVSPSPVHLKMHTDADGGILIFYYLSGVDDDLGSTRFLPETQSLQTPAQFVPEELYASRMKDIRAAKGGPGTALIFDQDVWHDLPPVTKPGRRAVWCLYQPQSYPQGAVDHLYRQSLLAGLSERQLRAFGIGQPAFQRAGYLRNIGAPFNLTHARAAIKYFLKFRKLVLSPPRTRRRLSSVRRAFAPRTRMLLENSMSFEQPKQLVWDDAAISRFWAYYAGKPETYFSYQQGDAVLARVKSQIGVGASVLDYGCGPGHLLSKLLDAGFRVTGADLSLETMGPAKEKATDKPGFEGIFTIDDLIARGRTFDAVFLLEVVEHLTDGHLSATLDNTFRLLAPGGKLVVTTPNEENLADNMVYCPVSNVVFHRWQHVRSWSKASLAISLCKHGFGALDIQTCTFESYDEAKIPLPRRLVHRAMTCLRKPRSLIAIAQR